jgi:uncharacterized protein (UPF0264 family)
MTLVLGGSLDLASLPEVLAWRPDYVAFRGAACSGPRDGKLDSTRLASLVEAVRGSGIQVARIADRDDGMQGT